jgi:hypothetical protein
VVVPVAFVPARPQGPVLTNCPTCPASAPDLVQFGMAPCAATILIVPRNGICSRNGEQNCVPAGGCAYNMNIIVPPGAGCCPLVGLQNGPHWVIWPSQTSGNTNTVTIQGSSCQPAGGIPATTNVQGFTSAGDCATPTPMGGPMFALSCGSC